MNCLIFVMGIYCFSFDLRFNNDFNFNMKSIAEKQELRLADWFLFTEIEIGLFTFDLTTTHIIVPNDY